MVVQLGPIQSLVEYVELVIGTLREWFGEQRYPHLWYRGAKNSEHDLLPSAYWRQHCDELALVQSFRQMAPSLLPSFPHDDWEWYYLMRHYGLPTRLLDWSENPMAALYFALAEQDPQGTPVVWMLDPVALNRGTSNAPKVFVPTAGSEIDYWLPANCGRNVRCHEFPEGSMYKSNALPIAIFPMRNNVRIVAQKGVFTVHGTDEVPLNHLPIQDEQGRDRLARIEIDPQRRQEMLDDLWAIGVNRTAIYPEPQSVAKDLVRAFNVH